MDEFATHCFGFLHAPKIEESSAWRDTSIGEVIKVGTMPLVWEATWICRSEFTFEWPNWVIFLLTKLVIVRETFDAHVSNVLAHL